MTTASERAAAQRQAKLRSIRRQVKSGRLVVRQMTAEEQAALPPLPDPPSTRKRAPWPTP